MNNAELSRLLFEAREVIDMYGDLVERELRRSPQYCHEIRDRIDAYRAERGWDPNGYGDEAES